MNLAELAASMGGDPERCARCGLSSCICGGFPAAGPLPPEGGPGSAPLPVPAAAPVAGPSALQKENAAVAAVGPGGKAAAVPDITPAAALRRAWDLCGSAAALDWDPVGPVCSVGALRGARWYVLGAGATWAAAIGAAERAALQGAA